MPNRSFFNEYLYLQPILHLYTCMYMGFVPEINLFVYSFRLIIIEQRIALRAVRVFVRPETSPSSGLIFNLKASFSFAF